MENESSNDAHGSYDLISQDSEVFSSSLYSMFTPIQKLSVSPSDSSTTTNSNSSQSPNDSYSNEKTMAAATTKQALSFIVQNHQDLVNRHNLCLNHLREASREAEALRRENASLRILNRELNDRLALMIQSALPPRSLSPNFQEVSLMHGFGGLCIGGDSAGGRDGFVESPSPTSVMENNVMEMPMEPVRIALPKSISVRSDGYLKTNPGSAKSGAAGGGDNRARSSTRVPVADPVSGKQKVYVQGGKKEGEAVELEVYNQGMVKTELCNKWQETGSCPYGDHCQFAHGIEELRPVLRHPRYKTEVCRMVLAGDPCPYGHRCHFRHALTEQEKLMMSALPEAQAGLFASPPITSNKVK
uniref:C3H1-type domain-containing protein n=1 Tax=Kalanchoe fedtschenkoi TaxID=63787 RepID=A0A7N0VAL6_KALFE